MQRGRHSDRLTEKQTETDRQKDRQRQTDRKTAETDRQTDRQVGRTIKPIDRQTQTEQLTVATNGVPSCKRDDHSCAAREAFLGGSIKTKLVAVPLQVTGLPTLRRRSRGNGSDCDRGKCPNIPLVGSNPETLGRRRADDAGTMSRCGHRQVNHQNGPKGCSWRHAVESVLSKFEAAAYEVGTQ